MIDVVTNGAANNAMPANLNTLDENEIALVVGYVASLRGQMLEGPRGVEGEEIPPFPEPISADQGG
jgi:cytochrome c oxidase cbb3-type subunit 3